MSSSVRDADRCVPCEGYGVVLRQLNSDVAQAVRCPHCNGTGRETLKSPGQKGRRMTADPPGVRFTVECTDDLLAQPDLRWPDTWTVTPLGPCQRGFTTWIEVVDTDAPPELAELVCCPTIIRDDETGELAVLSYNPRSWQGSA